jgi:hypothetical protein
MMAVLAAAQRVPPERRSDFLEAAAVLLVALPGCSDCTMHRAVMILRARYAPAGSSGKSARG